MTVHPSRASRWWHSSKPAEAPAGHPDRIPDACSSPIRPPAPQRSPTPRSGHESKIEGKRILFHHAPGFHANVAHHPTSGTTVVMFTNCPSCAAGNTDTWQLIVDFLIIADTSSA